MKAMKSEQKTILKRGILLGSIVLLLIVAAWVNGISNDPAAPAGAKTQTPSPSAKAGGAKEALASSAPSLSATGDYFADFRAERAGIRAEQVTLLDSVINAEADSSAVREASERKIAISRYMEQEFALEQTLLAKGYEDIAVIVRDELTTIAVKKPELNKTDAARILEAAMQETGMSADNIKIIPVQEG